MTVAARVSPDRNPAVLLHNLQVMAARDSAFSATTAPVRQLLSDDRIHYTSAKRALETLHPCKA